MIYIIINIVPILATSLICLAVAAIWYRRGLLSVGVGITVFASLVWLNAILAGALILAPSKAGIWTMTLGSAVVIWVGFVLPVIVASYRLRGQGWGTIAIDTGYWLVAMLVSAAVMRIIGLTPPPI
jgi:hypothetical protein